MLEERPEVFQKIAVRLTGACWSGHRVACLFLRSGFKTDDRVFRHLPQMLLHLPGHPSRPPPRYSSVEIVYTTGSVGIRFPGNIADIAASVHPLVR